MLYSTIKRSFDLACAGIGLLLLLPVGLLIALSIKLCDRGPLFYAQTRIGQNARPFRMWKFRSMVVDADKMGAPVTKDRDPRITFVGRFLRKFKLDELPQLWNVLAGEMSIVGPRPEVPKYVNLYTPEQRRILEFKPGITDLATMLFRHEEELLSGSKDLEGFYLEYCLPKKIELNLQYAHRASLQGDLWIILQTLCPYWVAVLVTYAIALAFSFWLAYALRSDFILSRHDYAQFRNCLLWIVSPQLILLGWGGQLRGLMSYFSIPEMRRILRALAVAFAVQLLICHWFLRTVVPTFSIILMDFILSFFALCSIRMCFRLLRENLSAARATAQTDAQRVAIIGTGETATNLALDFARSAHPARRVVAFFDDDPRAWNKRPHNIPVFGMPECLLNPEWLKKIDEVIVALPEENPVRLAKITEMLKPLPLKVTLAPAWKQ